MMGECSSSSSYAISFCILRVLNIRFISQIVYFPSPFISLSAFLPCESKPATVINVPMPSIFSNEREMIVMLSLFFRFIFLLYIQLPEKTSAVKNRSIRKLSNFSRSREIRQFLGEWGVGSVSCGVYWKISVPSSSLQRWRAMDGALSLEYESGQGCLTNIRFCAIYSLFPMMENRARAEHGSDSRDVRNVVLVHL